MGGLHSSQFLSGFQVWRKAERVLLKTWCLSPTSDSLPIALVISGLAELISVWVIGHSG